VVILVSSALVWLVTTLALPDYWVERGKERKEGRKKERKEERKEGRKKERKEERKKGRKKERKEGRRKERKEGRKRQREIRYRYRPGVSAGYTPCILRIHP